MDIVGWLGECGGKPIKAKALLAFGLGAVVMLSAPHAHADANSYLSCLSQMRIYTTQVKLTSW